jgi:hypothetical protein
MKLMTAALSVLLLNAAAACAQTAQDLGDGPQASKTAPSAAQPAYRMVEGISDGVYDFMRLHVIGSILPERLTRNLKAAPRENSGLLFDQNLREKESRFLARARAAYPRYVEGGRPASQDQIQAWRDWARAEQISVGIDAIGDTLIKRYQLELFGDASGSYAKDRRNWDPGFLSMASVLGGTFLYLNGLHATAHFGQFKIGLDVASGMRLREALQSQGEYKRLASLELGRRNLPVAFTTELGSSAGKVVGERFGLVFRRRF